MIQWIEYAKKSPDAPSRPFEVYLVWTVHQKRTYKDGGACILQFSKELDDFLDLPPEIYGGDFYITHWAEIHGPNNDTWHDDVRREDGRKDPDFAGGE